MSTAPSKPAYGGLLVLSALLALAALVTLWPWTAAPWPNVLGYRSLCSFAPASTLVCALAAGLCCTLRRRFVLGYRKAAWLPTVVLGVLLVASVGTTVVWAQVKADAIDAHTAATTPKNP